MRLKAILPQFSSFVSASAGTGKTKTLIDRLLNLLLHDIKPSKILCLAFTKSASAEILSRINYKLAQFCVCSREELLIELTNLGFNNVTSDLEYKARILFTEFTDATEPLNIQTIHSFCQQLLAKFPFEAGINLDFTLLDNEQIRNLIDTSKNILLNSLDDHSSLKSAIKYLSWHIKEYSLDELIKEIINNREKLDYFFRVNKDLNLEIDNIEDIKIAEFIAMISINQSCLDLLNTGGKSDINRAKAIAQFLSYPKDLQIMMIDNYLSCFLTQTGEPLKTLATKALLENNPHLYDLLLLEQQRVYQFSKIYNEIKLQNLTQSFIILSYFLKKIYKDLKQQNNALDYDDLISLSSDLLSNSEYAEWIRYKLDGGIDHILVDESQDNSPNQWTIINKISEEFFYPADVIKSLFIVGDSKQSIFKFQGADPQIFNQMNQYLPKNIVRVQLNTSFRSGKKILQFVDNIFNLTHIKPLVSHIEEIIEHVAHKDLTGSVEIWPLIIEQEKEAEKSWILPSDYTVSNHQNADELLAIKIAEQISQWLKEKKFIQSKNRSIIPGDILVLTRRRNNFVRILIKILRQMNIPTAGLDRLKLLEHPAVLDLIALSNVILCQDDDLNLAITLKSPIFNLSEEQLMHLCFNREKTLWQVLKDKPEYQDIYYFFTELNPQFLFQFYFDLIESRGLRKIFIKEFGIEANDVLDAFLDIVEKFEKDNISNLQLFINFLNNSAAEIQRDLSQSSNQVRIMTVHGSKGLQAPIVILTDTTSLPHNDDSIIWLQNDKLLWPGKTKYYSENAIKAKAEGLAQEYAEYLRLLYVALTRAEDAIIITGTSKSEEVSTKTWYSICQTSAP